MTAMEIIGTSGLGQIGTGRLKFLDISDFTRSWGVFARFPPPGDTLFTFLARPQAGRAKGREAPVIQASG